MRELGLGLQGDKRPGAYADLARRAEEAGFDVVTVFNDLFFQPALPPLLEIARATERVRVGPSALNPFTTHPVEIAGQVASLDAESGGRAFLGLAAGAWLDRLGLDTARSLTAIRETWEIVGRCSQATTRASTVELFHLDAGNRARVRAGAAVSAAAGRHVVAASDGFRRRGSRRAEARRLRQPGNGRADPRAPGRQRLRASSSAR